MLDKINNSKMLDKIRLNITNFEGESVKTDISEIKKPSVDSSPYISEIKKQSVNLEFDSGLNERLGFLQKSNSVLNDR